MKEALRVRHYIRYMDDFVLLLGARAEARARLAEIEAFLEGRLRLRLNLRRVVLAPLRCPTDFLGYVSGELRRIGCFGPRWRDFFSREEPRMHVHVHHAEGEAKFWLEPEIELARNHGLSRRRIRAAL